MRSTKSRRGDGRQSSAVLIAPSNRAVQTHRLASQARGEVSLQQHLLLLYSPFFFQLSFSCWYVSRTDRRCCMGVRFSRKKVKDVVRQHQQK
jgi:hypothetical protein